MVGAGRSERPRVDGGDHAVVHAQRHAVIAETVAQPLLPAPAVSGDAGGHVHLGGLALRGERTDLPDDRPRAHHQPAIASAQRGVEVGQAFREEGAAVGRVEADCVDTRIEYEQRHHFVCRRECGAQWGMVVQTQIRGEQDDRDGHGVTPGVMRWC